MDVFIQYAIAASQFAMDDARLDDHAEPTRATSASSSARASAGSPPSSASTRRCSRAGRARSRRSSSPRPSSTWPPARCRSGSAPRGRTSATCTACSASAHAIGESFEIIQRGDADAMIAGGSEAAITPMGVGGFAAMRALSHAQRRAGARQPAVRQGSRRLRDRRGRRRRDPRGARARAARAARTIYAEMVGYGMSGDAYHITAPSEDGDGAVRVDADGAANGRHRARRRSTTSTPTAPRRRTTTASRRWRSRRVFGDHADKLAISSTKSMTGHLLGAAGGLEAGITALAVHHQMAAADDQPRHARPGLRPRLRAEHEARR